MNSDNRDYANNPKYFANRHVMQSTLRELHNMVTSYKFWIGFFAVIILLAVTGPFGTQNLMVFSQRLFYWAVISCVTFFIGSAISLVVGFKVSQSPIPDWSSWIISGAIAGPLIGVFTWLINIYLYNLNIANEFSFHIFLAYTTAIASMVSLLSNLISPIHDTNKTMLKDKKQQAAFFSRLPQHLGKELISLEAHDHYVQVTTKNGKELVLMRLVDAEKELATHAGLRVHRSWWVAKSAIKNTRRANGKVTLILKNGQTIPVSRSYTQALRKLGI